MEHTQERPQVCGSDLRSFERADSLAELGTLVDGLLRNEPIEGEPPLELFAVGRTSGAVEQSDEILKKRVCAALRDEYEAVVLGVERIGVLEVLPEIADGLLAFVVFSTDGETAFHLPYEPRICRANADYEEVVRVEAEMLGLEMDFGDAGICQYRRYAADEELG